MIKPHADSAEHADSFLISHNPLLFLTQNSQKRSSLAEGKSNPQTCKSLRPCAIRLKTLGKADNASEAMRFLCQSVYSV